MSISPFSARPVSPEGERRRARLVVAIATVGIAATLLAYAISPGVRHAVGHAAHSVKHAVGHVLDRDQGEHARAKSSTQPSQSGHAKRPAGSSQPTGSAQGAPK
jgi:type II secretory pathway pseudopilin PulG